MKKTLLVIGLFIILIPFSVKGDSLMIYSEIIDSINGIRYENYLVYYPDNGQDVSGANVWGYEIAVNHNNVVVESNTNVKMVAGGFILSAHGTKKVGLQNVQVGDIVDVDIENMLASVFRDPVLSSYLRSLSNKDKAYNNYLQATNNYITFDEEEVNILLGQIDTLFTEIQTIYNNQEIDVVMETRMVTIAYEIQDKSEEVIYMTSKTSTIDIRAVWHRPNATNIKENNLAGVQSLLDKFKSLGFNAIYIESFWNGYVSGRSDILETHPNISDFYYGEIYGNDYLKAFVTEANLRGIDVHAWVHTFNAGNATNLSDNIKNEWLVENYQGETLHPNTYGGSYYLDPSNPEVLEFVLSMLEEMMQDYTFSGMQLDYIRYYDNNYNLDEIRDSGYNALANEKFKNEYDLTGDVRNLILDTQYRSYWNEWRQNNISNAVEYFVSNLREIKPNIIISADVVGDLSSARNTYMQDWLTWVRAGYIDLLCPMIYTSSNDRLESLSQDVYNKLDNFSFLSSGIAPVYYGYSNLNQHEQIVIASKTGGSAIFASHNIIGDNLIEKSLEEGTFRNEAVSPFAAVNLIVETVMNKVEGLINNNIDDETIKSMFLSHIENIILLNYRNPGEYQIGLEKVTFMRQLTPYISDEILSSLIEEELLSLEHVLDVRITRELIALGLYSPNDEERPNPLDFDYEIEEEPNEEEPNEEEPNEEEPNEEDPNKEGLSILQYVTPIIIFLFTIIMVTINIVLKRRKVWISQN